MFVDRLVAEGVGADESEPGPVVEEVASQRTRSRLEPDDPPSAEKASWSWTVAPEQTAESLNRTSMAVLVLR